MSNRILALILALCLFLSVAVGCKKDPTSGEETESGADRESETNPIETEPHIHEYSEWKTVKDATCAEVGKKERTCSCGVKESENIPKKGHTYRQWTVTMVATCTSTGERRRDCQNCNDFETVVIPKTEHNYSAVVTPSTCTAKGYVTYTCTCGYSYIGFYFDLNEHRWNDGVVTKEPTESENGLRVYTCSACGDTREETIPHLNHTHSYTEVVTAPTCTEQGYTTHTCTCGDTYRSDYTPATEHDFGEWTVITAATCTSAGEKCRDCKKCDCYETEIISTTEHNYSMSVTAPTCTKSGYTTYTCTCGDTYRSDYTPATEHDFGEWTVTTAATCTSVGEKRRDCKKCNHYETEDIPLKAHTPTTDRAVEATCTETGLTEGSHCSVCEYVITAQTVIPQKGHNYVNGVCTSCGRAWSSEGLRFELDSSGTGYCLVGLGTCTDTNIVIPAEYNGKPVTSIDSDAFPYLNYYSSQVRSITVPNSVTSIGGGAFYGCRKLRSITLPFVGEAKEKTSNTDFDFIFDGNTPTTLKTVVITGGTEIADYAFDYCSYITSITIPDGLTSIGSYAFKQCTSLKEITVPDSVISIGEGAFAGCSRLESITIPFVGNSANASENTYRYPFGYIFGTVSGGTATQQYYFAPNSYSQKKCNYYIPSSLKNVTVTGGSVNNGAFYNCSNITTVTLGNNVTDIDNYAFYNCISLTSITIGSGVTQILSGAFENCDSLESVYITDMASWCNIYHYPYSSSNPLSYAHNLYLNGQLVTDLVIPDGVTSIGDDAFKCCESLTSITIPDSVTNIGAKAFMSCANLKDVIIGSGVNSVGFRAFEGCNSIESITLPFVGETPDDSENYYFCYLFGGGSEYDYGRVPRSLKKVVITCASKIDSYAFYNCSWITSITVSDSVTSIGYCAFSGCTSLMNIKFEGTKSQWNAISKGTKWNYNTGSYTIYCTDGNISK